MKARCIGSALIAFTFGNFSTSAQTSVPTGIAYEVVRSMQADDLVGRSPFSPVTEGSDGALYGTTLGIGEPNTTTIFRVGKDGDNFRTLHLFGSVPQDGVNPRGKLLRAANGLLYGTTEQGGRSNAGTIFRIGENGRNYAIIFHFERALGQGPRGALLTGDDGSLYGTTQFGGGASNGVIYKLNLDGTGFRLLHQFGIGPFDGESAPDGLAKGSDGVLYGVTREGGNSNRGTIFRIEQDGSGYATIHHFGDPVNGQSCESALVEAGDGFLYGTTLFGGTNSQGVIFRLSRDGSSYEVVHNLVAAAGDGGSPWCTLVEGTDGSLYGATRGPSVVFRYNWQENVYAGLANVDSLSVQPSRFNPGLLRGSDGLLYGVSDRGGAHDAGMLYRLQESGSNLTKIVDFGATNFGGVTPRASLVLGTDGLYYGSTERGGVLNLGTIFAMSGDGFNLSVIRHFGAAGDGRLPNGVIEGSDGLFYGTTQQGGTAGQGILFAISKNGSNHTVLRSFAVGPLSTDGKTPRGNLVEAPDGFLYGLTSFGGLSNRGTVFRIGKDGSNYSIIHDFLLATHGAGPRDLILGSDQVLYGITTTGGITNRGTIFRCARDGNSFDVLHRFAGAEDGHAPMGGLLEATDGYIYGTTFGNSTNGGTIFRTSKDGTDYSVIHRFVVGDQQGGWACNSRLMEDSSGALLGTTQQGGLGNGVIFMVGKDGSGYRQLYRFGTQTPDALAPVAGLTRSREGSYYGVSEAGGAGGVGAIFRFDPRLVEMSIARTMSGSILEWPKSSTLDQLQQNGSLSSNQWNIVAEPLSDLGDRFRVTVPDSGGERRFFRVRREWR
jgi:uncharacterized repeat protein (TIGR03803 family)